MSFSDGCSNSEAKLLLRPIVSLTETLLKKVLEPIVMEAMLRHRLLRDIAELRLTEVHDELPGCEAVGSARLAFIRAMIECHAQQACLSTLLDVLGYVPDMPAEPE